MEIRQLEYMLTIIKTDFNLTKASELLMVSQPALSKMITNFEDRMEIKIFDRKKGRLVGLTPAGEVLVKQAQVIVDAHNEMNNSIKHMSKKLVGHVRFGIPSMILGVLFTNVILKFVIENPHILFEIIEGTATQLEKKFLDSEIDILISISTNSINKNNINRTIITSEPFVAIMDINNSLTKHDFLEWKDLNNANLSLPTDKYFVRTLVEEKMKFENVESNVIISAVSHEFLIKSAIHSNLIPILPRIFYDSLGLSDDNLVCRSFLDPIYWDVEMRTRKCHVDTGNVIGFAHSFIKDSFPFP